MLDILFKSIFRRLKVAQIIVHSNHFLLLFVVAINQIMVSTADVIENSSLVYVSPEKGGIYRKGTPGKFNYEDHKGNKVTDRLVLERIQKLVLPPAWKEVWISPKKNGNGTFKISYFLRYLSKYSHTHVKMKISVFATLGKAGSNSPGKANKIY